MMKTKEIQEKGIYLFTGRSNANSCFIEKISHAKQFLTYANYFLKGYLTVYDYVIDRDGWSMLVKIRSNKKLKELTVKDKDVWIIISERIRLFMSTFVRVTNKSKGRTGCLVHSSYERYAFDSIQEAKIIINKIRKQKIKHFNGRKKYRGIKSHYKIGKLGQEGSVFLCSKDIKKARKKLKLDSKTFRFIKLRKIVVSKKSDFITKTKNHQNPT